MLQDGIIAQSNYEFSSRALLVPKADGSMLFSIDYRDLKNLTIKFSYPLPSMDKYFDSLGDANSSTTLHANCGYW